MDTMNRTGRPLSKALSLVALALLTCTKIPSDMATLTPNVGATSLLAPADGSTDNILAPRLMWESVAGATGYHVQVSTASDFSVIAFEDSAVSDTFKAAVGLKYKTMYYWRVQVHDARSLSDWTMYRIFTTIIEPQTPAIVSPKDSATGAPTTLTLIWNSAGGAASYFVQVASDTGFTGIVTADSTLGDTAKLVTGLSNNQTYYWRIRSQNPGGVSAWTAMKSFTTIVAAPVAPTLNSPASGAVNQQLSLTLSWSTVSNASTYYLQVATDLAFADIVFKDSAVTDTSMTVSGLANGVLYYWRVMAQNQGGVSAWSNLSGFTTIAAAPKQPSLISPADGAVGQTIPLTVIWNKAVGAATYVLQVATDTGFTLISAADSMLTDTAKSLAGLANSTKYYWRVQAKNPTGASAWSTVRSFTTFAAALGTPVLRSPADAATGQPVAAVVSWQAVSGAKNYRVQASMSNDFSTIFVQDSGLTDTSATLAGLVNNTTYFWRARAENAAGFGNWTSPWRFTTIMAAPQIPALVAPADAATGQQLSLALAWNTAAGAATYSLQVAADSNFGSIVAADSIIADTAQTVTGLLNSTTYYWRVASRNPVGTSGWSVRRSFTTFAATLQTPTLTSPQNGATGISIVPTLIWSTVANATTYEVQVSGVNDFSTVLTDDATLTSGSKPLSALLNSTMYYWRVRAKSLSGTSNWTDSWTFTTIITVPATPVLVLPNDNAGGQPVSLSLLWNRANGAATYYVQVAADTGFVSVISSDSTLTDTSKAVSGLANGSTYYWRVQARNLSGGSAWSVRRSFTTIRQFTLTITAANGSVTISPNQAQYDSGAVLTLIATPAPGYQFTGWSGDASGASDTATIIMNRTKGVTANFAIATYQLTVIAGSGGAFTAPSTSPVTVSSGTPTTITASPIGGYVFANWSVTSGTAVIASAASTSTTVTLSSGNATVTANFAVASTYQLTVIAGTGGAFTAPTTSPVTVSSGAPTTITATPIAGYSFGNWSVTSGTAAIASASSASTTVTLTFGNATVTANFVPITAQLTVIAGTGGTITAPSSSPVTVNYGAATTITALPITGYSFVNWTAPVGTATIANASSDTTTVTLTNGAATVQANFKPICQWTAVNNGLTNTDVISLNSNGNNIFAGTSGGGAFLSTNSGTSWAAVNSGLTSGYVFSFVGVNSRILAGTGGGVFVSADNGTTWIDSGLTGYAVFSLATNGNGTFAGTNGFGVFVSQDNGVSWSAVNTGLGNLNVPDLLATSGVDLFAGTYGGGVFHSIGGAWTAVNTGLTNDTILCLAASGNGNNIFAGTNGGGVFISTNNGATWTAVNSGIPSSEAYIQSLFVSGSSIFAGTSFGQVFLSTNNGASWNLANVGLGNQPIMSFTGNGLTIFAGTGTGVFSSPMP